MSPNRRRNGTPKSSQAENCRNVQFLVVNFWIFLNHRCCFLFPQIPNLSRDGKKCIKIPKISQEKVNWNSACNHFKEELWLVTSLVCWLQSSKIPRNNPSFMYQAQIGCRNQPRHLCADLTGGEMGLGLSFSRRRKRPRDRILGNSTFTWIFIQLLKACRTCSIHVTPNTAHLFYSQLQQCLKHLSKHQGLLGINKVWLFMFIHTLSKHVWSTYYMPS